MRRTVVDQAGVIHWLLVGRKITPPHHWSAALWNPEISGQPHSVGHGDPRFAELDTVIGQRAVQV